ncbi:spore coat protein X [Tumebacillus sp. BK434]|uniref:spore coat protein n=1 Tax=Tumebacillus sp. BK434 TaxID=2512169 RepID=UPI0010E0237B|nr:spore coat protein [Tumebacillus sp. BK434]TCP58206.1 spore coat protein X [Tumebacillus sp. BK434]
MANWSALDSNSRHPLCREEEIVQEAAQISRTLQKSDEVIIIRDSFGVDVRTTDTKAAVNLQVALQLAIAVVLSLTIADGNRAEAITQELLQKVQVKQVNKQRTVIENSRNVEVVTTDTDVAANIQVLVQVLLALVAKIEVL